MRRLAPMVAIFTVAFALLVNEVLVSAIFSVLVGDYNTITAIAVRSTKLPGEFHPDPADRIIVATALENAVPIITPDDRIRSYPHVQSGW